jgi:hypothetical protein
MPVRQPSKKRSVQGGPIGYARVSTDDQNLALQLDAIKKSGCDRVFTDKASGSGLVRPIRNLQAQINDRQGSFDTFDLENSDGDHGPIDPCDCGGRSFSGQGPTS